MVPRVRYLRYGTPPHPPSHLPSTSRSFAPPYILHSAKCVPPCLPLPSTACPSQVLRVQLAEQFRTQGTKYTSVPSYLTYTSVPTCLMDTLTYLLCVMPQYASVHASSHIIAAYVPHIHIRAHTSHTDQCTYFTYRSVHTSRIHICTHTSHTHLYTYLADVLAHSWHEPEPFLLQVETVAGGEAQFVIFWCDQG